MRIYNLKLKQVSYIVVCSLAFLFITMFLILNSSQNLYVARQIVDFWLKTLVPSLFPFLIFSEIVLSTNIVSIISNFLRVITNKVFRLPSICSIPILLGFICGFPMGSKVIFELYDDKRINRKQALQLMRFVNNANPVFIVASIGIGMFQNLTIGILLLISHMISSIIIGICVTSHNDIIQENKEDLKRYLEKTNMGTLIRNSIISAFYTLVSILGYILIFNLFSNFVTRLFNIDNMFIKGIFEGILEMSCGIHTISRANISNITQIVTVSFILGFSGFCVLFQCISCIGKLDVKFFDFVCFKIFHGILSAFITYILIKFVYIFKVNVMTSSAIILKSNIPNVATTGNIYILYTLLTVSSFLFIISIFKVIFRDKRKAAK